MSNVIAFPNRAGSQQASTSPPSDALSFVKRRKGKGGGYNYWSISSSGNYTADCAAGKLLAVEYLAFIGKYPTAGNATLLNCIVREMIEQAMSGNGWSGMHLTFIGAVNECAMATAVVMQGKHKVE
jgi:hypothetical protein